MSLYREASGRGKTVVGAVVVGAAVAMLALGFFVGRATAPGADARQPDRGTCASKRDR